MAKRFRCYMCDQDKAPTFFEYESGGPQCPKCGFTGPPSQVPLRNVHFLSPVAGAPIKSSGQDWAVACKPTRPSLENIAATGDANCVTCPACKLTEPYGAAMRLIEELRGD